MSTLSKNDQDMRTALAALDSHESAMRQAGSTANSIKEDIAHNYIANSSSTFQNKVDEWVDGYNQLMGTFKRLRDDLQSASGAIDGADDEAVGTGSSWSPEAGSTYTALMGHH